MIRPTDAFVLAYTKLQTHKVRTGLTVGIAGILFGLMLAVIFVVQGVFDSVERFGKEGLADRSIVVVSRMNYENFSAYDKREDAKFIAEVEALHKAAVNKKKAAAEKYHVDYDEAHEDPSPIVVDPSTKQKVIPEENMGNAYVIAAAKARGNKEKTEPFDIDKFLRPYASARILPDHYEIAPSNGALTYMLDGKENLREGDESNTKNMSFGTGASGSPSIGDLSPMVMNGSVAKPFVTSHDFDAKKGEIPVIIPYSQAEKLLGLTRLEKKVSAKERLDRLYEVRHRVSEITIDYCYRNVASQQLLATALAQEEEIERGKKDADYQKPSRIYKVPSNTSCGAVTVSKDIRTSEEKQQELNQIAYEKEIGTYLGSPVEQKMTLRGVGVVGEMATQFDIGVVDMVTSLLGSNLGWGSLVVPADMLKEVPEEYRPAALFQSDHSGGSKRNTPIASLREESYLIEFDNKDEARTLLQKSGALGGTDVAPELNSMYASQFGSNALLVDEFKQIFMKAVVWALVVIGGIAAVIMSSMIGRTVSEGRRESAVFRAIGAKRSDIAAIYSSYAFLLSVRVVIFALVLGGVLALLVEFFNHESATVGARLAYAASDTSLEFHLFSVVSWHTLLVIATILVVGVFASIIPIIRSARRNPIADMRDDT